MKAVLGGLSFLARTSFGLDNGEGRGYGVCATHWGARGGQLLIYADIWI